MTFERKIAAAILLISLAVMSRNVLPAAEPDSVVFTENTEIKFATVEQARTALARDDAFLQTIGGLELQLRLASEQAITREQYIERLKSEVLPWSPPQQAAVTAALKELKQRIKGLDIPLPPQVLLICTSGKEEANAAYTRSNSIVLPTRRIDVRQSRLQRLLAHELFHVISRHDHDLRRRLYQTIGFRPCGQIDLPPSVRSRQITNPDAPTYEYCITVKHEGEQYDAIPVLLARSGDYREMAGQPIFKVMRFNLLLGHLINEGWQPALNNGEPILIAGDKSESYRQQIGNNTSYIIHPDEVLADNFVHLLLGTKELPNPEIVHAMRRVMTSSADTNDRTSD